MSLSITIHFPVSLHVKKYLMKKTATRPDSVYYLDRKDAVGKIILNLLQKKTGQWTKNKHKLPAEFKVHITENYAIKSGIYLPPDKVGEFNSIIDKQFREEMYQFMLVNVAVGNGKFYKQEMEKFLSYYGITEDDFSFDSFLRDFKRKKILYDNNLQPV